MTHELPRLLTAAQVSDATGLPLACVYKLARNGNMPVVRLGRAMRFSESALCQWIEHGGTASTNGEVGALAYPNRCVRDVPEGGRRPL